MNRKAFHLLLIRYLDGTCTDEERQLVDQWYELLEEEDIPSVPEETLDELEARLWENVRTQIAPPPVVEETALEELPVVLPRGRVKWMVAAALLAGLLAGAYYYFGFRNKSIDSLIGMKVQEGLLKSANHGSSTESIRLEDGSLVLLQPGASIAFPRHFPANKREVYLEGGAYFDVTRQMDRPFFVYNKTVVAEVLGTSFDISIVQNKIEVKVRTGKVAVFENGRQVELNAKEKIENGVIVTPNQKATYYEDNRHFVTSLVEAPVPVGDTVKKGAEPRFIYDDTPVAEVLAALEKTYQIEIILENERLGKCPFTGDISSQGLFNKLELICQTFQANYEVAGTQILIKGGKGCN